MKSHFCLLSTALALGVALAQGQSTRTNSVSTSDEDTAEETSPSIVSGSGGNYSLSEISEQLGELHRAVEETVPMLTALTQMTGTNAAPVSTGGALAGVLENILRGNTNQVSSRGDDTRQRGSTNIWGGILRGVLGTNGTATASGGEAGTLNDLVVLRQQLQTIQPILERLDSSGLNTNRVAQPSGTSSDDELSPTGRDVEQEGEE